MKSSKIIFYLIIFILIGIFSFTIFKPLRVLDYENKPLIISSGDQLILNKNIYLLDFFQPTFGKNRSNINHNVNIENISFLKSKLTFTKSGEYYLKLNLVDNLKVLVLSDRDDLSLVKEVFTFYMANHIWGPDEDLVHRGRGIDEDKLKYITNFFLSKEPYIINCGPTQDVLSKLLFQSLGFKSRFVMLPGFKEKDNLFDGTVHNVIETFIPSLKRWVFLDGDIGFLVPYDALSMHEKFISTISFEQRNRIDLIHLFLKSINLYRPFKTLKNIPYTGKNFRDSVPFEIAPSFSWLFNGPAYHLTAYAPNPELKKIFPRGIDIIYTDSKVMSNEDIRLPVLRKTYDYDQFDNAPYFLDSSNFRNVLDRAYNN